MTLLTKYDDGSIEFEIYGTEYEIPARSVEDFLWDANRGDLDSDPDWVEAEANLTAAFIRAAKYYCLTAA